MIRGVGLRSAVAINVATMVGAGPFITLPLVVAALNGSVSAVPWVTGALIALCDGLVWAELASRYPRSGATYAYLREAFGAHGPGRFAAFLFVWQYLFWAPLILASGYIGFAQYAGYLVPALAAPVPAHIVAAGVAVLTLLALYRAIPQIARTALVLGGIALITLLAVAFAGITHPYAPLARTIPATFTLAVGVVALGGALVQTLYDYSGYGDVCALGDEVIAPARTIPRAILLSVLFVGASYVLLNLGVASAVAPDEIMKAKAIGSLVAERAFGVPFAVAVTLAVMVTAFASTYGLLLAASRIPFAAARDGDFLAPFARLHRSGRFPNVSLVAIGLLSIPASLLPLDLVINALTAGIVLVQGAGQIVALALARRAQPDAPFRVPLYPLPPLIALAGWLFLFVSTGALAIGFGLLTLAVGAAVFLVRARVGRIWPFGTTAAVVLAIAYAASAPANAAAPAHMVTAPAGFGHARLVQRDGEPTLELDGKPFFFWGAAFFYERLPAAQWRPAMLALRQLGVNTLDLYVPWNWHELRDGEFDFDGHTNPRRNLREVLRLGKELGFAFVVRPGPVIRNEWRNGGYPAWLLTRPEYGMPLHDVLEGRYPATATLQNAHSDDAAAAWMANATHRRYASRWLHRALTELRPVADRVVAVQLDDDQGAYADNQTYPAPHLQQYLDWLAAQVRDVAGASTPLFINTYEMRVPASSPVWTMGNWYQSEAFTLGDHDRVALDLATAMLRTNRRGPLAISEFQAGWLAPPEDPQPRPADPRNTELALFELLGWGARGVIDFPMQDTLAPFGWEAPFSNSLYAWDAALRYPWSPTWPSTAGSDGTTPSAWIAERYDPTARFGELVRRFGALLAESRRVSDVALAYPLSSYPGDPAAGFPALARFREHLRDCAARGTPCDVVDLAYTGIERLQRYRVVVVGDDATRRARAGLLAAYRRGGGSVDASVPAERLPGTVLRGRDGTFVVAVNWSDSALPVPATHLRFAGAPLDVAAFALPPKSGRLVALGVRLDRLDPRYASDARISTTCTLLADAGGVRVESYSGQDCEVAGRARGRSFARRLRGPERLRVLPDGTLRAPDPPAFGGDDVIRNSGGAGNVPLSATTTVSLAGLHEPGPGAETYRADAFADGGSSVVLQNQTARAVLVPDGGARVPVFGLIPAPGDALVESMSNVFDATGGLRDDVLVQPPPSATDRIAKYTHSFPAGTFNRAYSVSDARDGSARVVADVPDVVPNGARFERVVSLLPGAARLVVDERATFAPGPGAEAQRAVVLSALSTANDRDGKAQRTLRAGDDAPAAGGALDAPRGVFLLEPDGPAGYLVVAVSWRPGDVESAAWEPHRSNGTLRLVLAPSWRRVTYAMARVPTRAAATAFVEAERAWVAANPARAR
ncbi:MAG TPA: amino acid permease [Candidatus Elarobacter sp.]|jgi:amino acid transporter